MRPTRRTRRWLALLVLIVAGLMPCLSILGYGVYLRSSLYRAAVERHLTEFFGLPTRVGRAVPLGWDELLLQDVEVYLPVPSGELGPGNRVAFCRTAQWIRSDQPGQFDLLLSDGEVDLTPARWAQGDFRKLEKSLRHDYREIGLRKVSLFRGGFRWAHDAFSCELGDAEGDVRFIGQGASAEGVARLRAGSFNGQPADILVNARIDPLSEAVFRPDIRDVGLVREFELVTSPDRPAPIPLQQFRLDDLLGGPVTSGRFTGRLSFTARLDGRKNVFTVSDAELTGLDLSEFTRGLPGGPVPGRLDVKVKGLRLEELDAATAGTERGLYVTDLRFSGVLSDLDLAASTQALGLPRCSGTARLEVTHAELLGTPDGEVRTAPIRVVSAAGSIRGLDLGELTGLLPDRFGGGRVRGLARVDRLQMSVVNGQLAVFQGDLIEQPSGPGGPPPVVDMALINAVVPWLPGLPVSLPPSLPYQSLRMHAFLSEGKLVIQGLGGSDGKALMTLLIPTPSWSRALGAADSIRYDVQAPGLEKPVNIDALTQRIARPIGPVPLRSVSRTVRDRLLPPRQPPTQ